MQVMQHSVYSKGAMRVNTTATAMRNLQATQYISCNVAEAVANLPGWLALRTIHSQHTQMNSTYCTF
jgi:hypothetical protein